MPFPDPALLFLVLALVVTLGYTSLISLTKLLNGVVETHYESYEEVIDDGAIRRGWVPSLLPESAYQIVEQHDLDTNTREGSFFYEEQDEEAMMAALEMKGGLYYSQGFQFEIDQEANHVHFVILP